MAGFVRRFTFVPPEEVITQIEGTVIIDLAPPAPVTGAGSGAVLIFGEFEDGPFAIEEDGITEAFGAEALRQVYGGFGYEIGGVPSSGPCARRHLAEDWNGNGFLKLFKLRAQRLMVARVDTSVGSVAFSPLACITGGIGPYQLADGQTVSATSTTGTGTSTAVAASVVTVPGVGSTMASVTAGDAINIQIDGGPVVTVVFAATDVTAALVASRINAALGFTSAVVNTTEVDISSLNEGSSATVALSETTLGALTKIGHISRVNGDNPLVDGTGQSVVSIVASDNFTITLDGGTPIVVTFAGSPADVAAAVLDINTQVGQTVAYEIPDGEIRFTSASTGTAATLALAAGAPDALTNLGHVPGTVTGSSNVGDVNAATSAEVAALINDSGTMIAATISSNVGSDGIRICADTAGDSILVTTGAMATAVEFDPLDTTVLPEDHLGGVIPAGQVVTDGVTEYVTMQTLDIPAGNLGPYLVKVRHLTDDGSGIGAAAGTVTTYSTAADVDFAFLTVTNPNALTVALTEPQLDNAYVAAMDQSLDDTAVSSESNFTLAARRSDAVVREGRSNALLATSDGLFARKFITGDPLGTSLADAISNVAEFRSDRVFYTAKGLKVRVPEIAELGVAGGTGFTEDGVITVRPDGPLTTVCAILPPEENPGQQTNLIDDFFAVDTFGEVLSIESYKAARREGISMPRVDRVSGTVFQSGVTSSLQTGLANMARRKMADFIQDTAAELFPPFSKKLNKQSNRDRLLSTWNEFLASLKSENNAELQRIEDFSTDDSINAGNTPASLAKGIYRIETRVRTLSSLDFVVIQTEIGENTVVTSTQVA